MSKDKNNITDSNNDNNKDFMNRINRLLDNNKELPSDDELAQRFKKVFDSEPVVNEKKKLDYSVPSGAHDEEIEQYLLEAQLLQSDNSGDDGDDDYLADILNGQTNNATVSHTSTKIQQHHDKTLKTWEDAFLGPEYGDGDVVLDDEGHELMQQLKDQGAAESKYASFEQQRNDELERRYLALKKDSDGIINSNSVSSSPTRQFSSHTGNQVSTSSTGSTSVPRGSVPKPLAFSDLHDEMDDWCCVCNEDAVMECEDCDNDRFCRQCFYDGHLSDMAEYGFSKHRARKYTK